MRVKSYLKTAKKMVHLSQNEDSEAVFLTICISEHH